MIVSKYRKKIFNNISFNYFKEIIDHKIREHIPEIQIIAMNDDCEHNKIIYFTIAKCTNSQWEFSKGISHIQISIPPKINICEKLIVVIVRDDQMDKHPLVKTRGIQSSFLKRSSASCA